MVAVHPSQYIIMTVVRSDVRRAPLGPESCCRAARILRKGRGRTGFVLARSVEVRSLVSGRATYGGESDREGYCLRCASHCFCMYD